MDELRELITIEAPRVEDTPLRKLTGELAGAGAAIIVALVALLYTWRPFLSVGIGSLAKDWTKRAVQDVSSSPRVKPYLEITVEEFGSRNRQGYVLSSNLEVGPGGFSEVAEEILKQLLNESEELKRRHLAKMLARAAEDNGASVDLIKLLLKIAPELTFEDMRLLEAFRRLGSPSGWRENALNRSFDDERLMRVARLRSHHLLTPNPGGFESEVSITGPGESLAMLLALEELGEDVDELAESIDPIHVLSDFVLGGVGVSLHDVQNKGGALEVRWILTAPRDMDISGSMPAKQSSRDRCPAWIDKQRGIALERLDSRKPTVVSVSYKDLTPPTSLVLVIDGVEFEHGGLEVDEKFA